MADASKAELCASLGREISIRTRKGVQLTTMAQKLERQGLRDMAKAVWEIVHNNEAEQIKLQAQIDALEC